MIEVRFYAQMHFQRPLSFLATTFLVFKTHSILQVNVDHPFIIMKKTQTWQLVTMEKNTSLLTQGIFCTLYTKRLFRHCVSTVVTVTHYSHLGGHSIVPHIQMYSAPTSFTTPCFTAFIFYLLLFMEQPLPLGKVTHRPAASLIQKIFYTEADCIEITLGAPGYTLKQEILLITGFQRVTGDYSKTEQFFWVELVLSYVKSTYQ